MRFYDIKLTGEYVKLEYTSWVNNKNVPGALQVEFDIPVAGYATPAGGASVTIWGIPLSIISQAHDLNGSNIEVYAGMQKGLPLANPAQQGLIMSGVVTQAFGNWIGTDQTLNLVVNPGGTPANLSWDWPQGTPISQIIQSTLKTAFPDYTLDIKVNPNVVLGQDDTAYYENIVQFSQYLKEMSTGIIGGSYNGIDIVLTGSTLKVFDGSTQSTPIIINFNDLIGQPTWIGPNQMQFNCVMRGDISVSDYVQMPNTLYTTTAASQSQSNPQSKTVFQGTFLITRMRHVGNFRSPDATSWITTFDAVPVTTP